MGAALFTTVTRVMVNGGSAANEVFQLVFEFSQEFRVVLVLGISVFQLIDGVGQRFGNETAAVNAEMTGKVRLVIVVHDEQYSLQVARRPHERLRRID